MWSLDQNQLAKCKITVLCYTSNYQHNTSVKDMDADRTTVRELGVPSLRGNERRKCFMDQAQLLVLHW